MYNDDDLYYKSYLRRSSNRIPVYIGEEQKTYCSYVKVNVRKSDSDEFSVKVRKTSDGRNRNIANQNAEALDYNYELNGNTLTLNAYFLSEFKTKYKDEKIEVTVYVPENTTIYFEGNTSSFLHRNYDVDNMFDSDMAEHYFLMTDDGLDCQDCEEEKEEETEEEKTLDTIN